MANVRFTQFPFVSTGTTTARTQPDRNAQYIMLEDFGGVGDSTTDNTAAWTAALARTLGARHLSISKVRQGDRMVELTWPEADQVEAHAVILADDICSTGATLEAALRHLSRMDPASIDVVVAHALFDGATEARLRKAGARRLISTDSCPHPTNAAPLADMMAQALKELA